MNPPPTTTTNTTTSACNNCASRTRWYLHNVRLRGIFRRLCTSCVLRLHPLSFCPSCFELHDPQPPHPLKRVTCTSCNSYTHSHCVTNPPTPYLCPPCANPNFTFFELGPSRAVDEKMAKVMLCAARIASVSMGKAVVVARVEAERKVREAAVARKRAKEALEHVAALVEARKRKEEEEEEEESGGVVSGVQKVEGQCDGVKKEEESSGVDRRGVSVGAGVGLGNGGRVAVKVESGENANGNGNGKVGGLSGGK